MTAKFRLGATPVGLSFWAVLVLALHILSPVAAQRGDIPSEALAFKELLNSWPQLGTSSHAQLWQRGMVSLCSLKALGVTCTPHGQVSEIDFSGQNLQGAIPTAIGKFPALTVLDLSNNGLMGTVPLSLTFLNHLEQLFLHENPLLYPVPTSERAFPALRILSLQGTKFQQCIIPEWAQGRQISAEFERACAGIHSYAARDALATPDEPSTAPSVEPTTPPTVAPLPVPSIAPTAQAPSTPPQAAQAPLASPTATSTPTTAATPTASQPAVAPISSTPTATPSSTPTSNSTAAPQSPKASKSLSGPSIAGIVVGAIILTLLIAIIIFFAVAESKSAEQQVGPDEDAADMGSPRQYHGDSTYRNDSKVSVASQPDVSKTSPSHDPSDNSSEELSSDSSDDYSDDSA